MANETMACSGHRSGDSIPLIARGFRLGDASVKLMRESARNSALIGDKEAEATILRLTRLYAAISHCNQAITRCASAAELFPQICRDTVSFGGMKMAWIGLIDEAGQQVKPVASFGDDDGYLADIHVSVDAGSPLGQGPIGTAIRENQPFWCQDFINDPRTAAWHERGARAGWAASAALPLHCNGVVIGAFALYAAEVNAFDADIRKLLVEMAMDISFALDGFAREAELKRSNAELEQFSYAISHDMRQPLRMISSYLKLIEKGIADQLDSEQREYFDFAIGGARRLDQMLVGLLEYARVGRHGEPPTWVESRAILDEALLFLQPAIAKAQADVRVRGEWPRVLVNPDEMLRLLQNLIDNALKYRVAGRAQEITVTSGTSGNEWRVHVSDNGVGILAGQIGRLFQVFQRLHSRTAYEGIGIGLALCRKIVERHGGRIWVESAGEKQGCSFIFTLPVAAAATIPQTPPTQTH